MVVVPCVVAETTISTRSGRSRAALTKVWDESGYGLVPTISFRRLNGNALSRFWLQVKTVDGCGTVKERALA